MDREPWSLLAELDELLARDDWQDDQDAVERMERVIALSVDGAVHAWTPAIAGYDPAPFLRSRDAAALLEEALLAYKRSIGDEPELEMHYFEGKWMEEWHHSYSGPPYVRVKYACEAAVRTRTALEAGYRMGFWPVKQ
jgi:hypothetical protein